MKVEACPECNRPFVTELEVEGVHKVICDHGHRFVYEQVERRTTKESIYYLKETSEIPAKH